MTIEQAKEEIPTFEAFKSYLCSCCSANDWYCPTDCETLIKAKKIFFKVQASYAKHDGDLRKVCNYINQVR